VSGRPNAPRSGPSAPLLPPARAARLLDDVIFARVAELMDLPRLYDLEAMLALQIEHLGTASEEARAIAKEMVDRALLRVARTSRKWTRWAPPEPDEDAATCERRDGAGEPQPADA
jgi:hypothetical protein